MECAPRVRFTLRLRDQWSKWMQDGCKGYMDFYMVSNGSYFTVTCTIFKEPPLGGRPNTKPEDQGTLKSHVDLLYFFMCKGPAWLFIHWNRIRLRAMLHMSSHYTRGPMTTLHNIGIVIWTCLSGSHNFVITAIGSCVEWPCSMWALCGHQYVILTKFLQVYDIWHAKSCTRKNKTTHQFTNII
jgi:hypothetical protein